MDAYYDDGDITLYHGDCREVLPLLGRDSIDLVVTDPPYGVGFQSGPPSRRSAPATACFLTSPTWHAPSTV
jgi:site-specific DNA-methyltransferase (adenine-specific)